MDTLLFLLVTLIVGASLGLAWRGTVLLGDRRAVDRLATQLMTEMRLQAETDATLRAMQRIAQKRQYLSED